MNSKLVNYLTKCLGRCQLLTAIIDILWTNFASVYTPKTNTPKLEMLRKRLMTEHDYVE